MHRTRAEAESLAAGSDAPAAPRPADPLLRLQALAGNDAVRGLVAPAPVQRVPAGAPAAPAVQRMHGGPPAAAGGGLAYGHDPARDEESPCGSFVHVRWWVVPAGFTGLIIQKVTREFDVSEVATGNRLSGTALDAYVAGGTSTVHATETTYWEAWTVVNGVVSDGGEDTFQSCAFIRGGSRALRNTTRGRYTVTGAAILYRCHSPAASATGLGFTRAGARMAGGLLSRASAPGTFGLDRVGDEFVYRVDVTWNSGQKDVYSKVAVRESRRGAPSYRPYVLAGAAAVALALAAVASHALGLLG